ncbi:Uncharacterized protein DAT39_019061, partial [Clarias magur]
RWRICAETSSVRTVASVSSRRRRGAVGVLRTGAGFTATFLTSRAKAPLTRK